MMRPWLRHTIRSDTPITIFMSCSTKRIVIPAVADALDELHELAGLGGVHARDGLVEQQQGRLRGERHRDFQEALFP